MTFDTFLFLGQKNVYIFRISVIKNFYISRRIPMLLPISKRIKMMNGNTERQSAPLFHYILFSNSFALNICQFNSFIQESQAAADQFSHSVSVRRSGCEILGNYISVAYGTKKNSTSA